MDFIFAFIIWNLKIFIWINYATICTIPTHWSQLYQLYSLFRHLATPSACLPHPKVCVWGVGRGSSSSSSSSTPPKTCLCLGLFIDEINYKLTRNSPGRVTGSGGDRYGWGDSGKHSESLLNFTQLINFCLMPYSSLPPPGCICRWLTPLIGPQIEGS